MVAAVANEKRVAGMAAMGRHAFLVHLEYVGAFCEKSILVVFTLEDRLGAALRGERMQKKWYQGNARDQSYTLPTEQSRCRLRLRALHLGHGTFRYHSGVQKSAENAK